MLNQAGFADEVAELRFNDGKLSFYAVLVNAYYASVAADFIRHKLLDAGSNKETSRWDEAKD